MKLTFKTTHRIVLPDSCEALIDRWEESNQQEKEITVAFANRVARHLALCNCPPFVLDFRELAQAKDITPMHIRISKLNYDGECILGLPQHQQLFRMTFEQFYQAKHREDWLMNYNGYARAIIMMEGDWNIERGRRVPPEFAEVAQEIIYGAYYAAVSRYCRDWHMQYYDDPSSRKPKAINDV